MKLYSYIIARDIGLAPNPWGYCTLALCTPNHMGIKPQNDDWIIGISPKDQGNQLIYAMQVSETLHFDEYYRDKRFENKKPNIEGTWQQWCGDNFYFTNQQGEWEQHPPQNFRPPEKMRQDLRYTRVFVAEKFYYFGDEAVSLPVEFQELIWPRQGCTSKHKPEVVEKFINWLSENYTPGVLGRPSDNLIAQCLGCS